MRGAASCWSIDFLHPPVVIERWNDMSMLSRALILLMLAAAFMVARPDCAFACSCMAPGTPVEERDRSDAVFSGKVVDIKPNANGFMVTFEVATVWKGQ